MNKTNLVVKTHEDCQGFVFKLKKWWKVLSYSFMRHQKLFGVGGV